MPKAIKLFCLVIKKKHIDGLIANSQQQLGAGYRVFHQAALYAILDDIKDDLADFGVTLMNGLAKLR